MYDFPIKHDPFVDDFPVAKCQINRGQVEEDWEEHKQLPGSISNNGWMDRFQAKSPRKKSRFPARKRLSWRLYQPSWGTNGEFTSSFFVCHGDNLCFYLSCTRIFVWIYSSRVNIMGTYHEVPWIPMNPHELPWITMNSHAIPLKPSDREGQDTIC